MKTQQQVKGFTLVEMAIVLVIIGLIIGGVLKGQELIENSRLTAVMNTFNGYRSGTLAFYDKYQAVPGDFQQAQERIPGCAGATCTNGNGDGIVGVQTTPLAADAVANAGEYRMYWQHLARANMVAGITPGAAAGGNVYGVNFPSARTGGGFVVTYTTVGTPAKLANWVRLQQSLPAVALPNTANTGALAPGRAAEIDRKMDDGNSQTGSVIATGLAGSCNTGATNGYDETVSGKDCNLFYQLLQ